LVPVLLAAVALFPSTPYGPADAAAWHQMLNRQCPGHHIDDWMPEQNKVNMIYRYEAALPSTVRANIARAADPKEVCAKAEGDGAASCPKIVEIHALRKLHLLSSFTTYACSQALCSESASCGPPVAYR
jgi:hypothetical protein